MRSLIAWAAERKQVTFRDAVRFLLNRGHTPASARSIVRTALERRSLIARTTLGGIERGTPLFAVDLRRGVTAEEDVVGALGAAEHRRRRPAGATICLWLLGEGRGDPDGRAAMTHRERDAALAERFDRSHLPFGPLVVGELLLLRCRFRRDGTLGSHRIQVVRGLPHALDRRHHQHR